MSPEQVVQFNPDYSDKTDFIVSVATQTDMSCAMQDALGTHTRLDSQQHHELNPHASVFVLTRNQKRQNDDNDQNNTDSDQPSIDIPTPQWDESNRPQADVREAEENAGIPQPLSRPQLTFSPEADTQSTQHCTPTADSMECSGDLLILPCLLYTSPSPRD